MIETAKRVLQIEAEAVLALQSRIDGDFTKAVKNGVHGNPDVFSSSRRRDSRRSWHVVER